MSINLILASDYRGVSLRKKLAEIKQSEGIQVKDIGIEDGSPLDYVDISKKLAEELSLHPNALGVIVCGSGQGVAIALNRYSHIRACMCRTVDDAENVKEKLNANVVCIGSKQSTVEESLAILNAFIGFPFIHGKHDVCINKLSAKSTTHSDNGANLIARAIITHKDHILLTAITKSNTDYANDLYFLPGGHVDHNEAVLDALKREIKEEMGVSLTHAEYAGVLECSWDKKGKVYHEINFVYKIQLHDLDLLNPPKAIDSVFHEFVWVPLSKINTIKILPETLKPLIVQAIESHEDQNFYSQMLTNE